MTGLGSVDTLTDASEALRVCLSYSAFGQRRREAGWAGDLTSTEWSTIYSITHRGYTFHEMLDDLDIIHMNGRIFDPYAARFASADPFIPDPLDPQSHNRYSYVRNNPLSFIDPSGFEDEEKGEGDNDSGVPGTHVPEMEVFGETIRGRDLRRDDSGAVSGTAMPIVIGTSEGVTGTTEEADKADGVGEIEVRAKRFKPRRRVVLIDLTVPLNYSKGTVVGGAVVGAATGAAHALGALAAGEAAGSLILAVAAASDVAALAGVGALAGAAAGVAIGAVFTGGYIAGTIAYNTFTDWYYH